MKSKHILSSSLALVAALATIIAAYLQHRPPPDEKQPSVVLQVQDAVTGKPIPGALVEFDGNSKAMADESGIAVFRSSYKNTATDRAIRVYAPEYKEMTRALPTVHETGTSIVTVPLVPLAGYGLSAASNTNAQRQVWQSNTTKDSVRVTVTKLFSSGPKLSGPGSQFSGWYEVVATAPSGYMIDPDSIGYYLAGDRTCNQWSECVLTKDVSGNFVFRFRLQGHNEWPPPGQAVSEGFLKVTFRPNASS